MNLLMKGGGGGGTCPECPPPGSAAAASGDCGGTGGSSVADKSHKLVSPINADRWVYNTDELIRYPQRRKQPSVRAWCGHISNCTNVMKREDMKGLLTKLGATTATSPLSNDLYT